jgi:hypothetical protein
MSSMEVRRVDDHHVALQLLVFRGDPEGRRYGIARGEQSIAWRWPERLGDFTLGFLGVLLPLPAWPPPWPVWVAPSAEGPPRVGDQALRLLLQQARLPDVVPYAQVAFDEQRDGCVRTLVDDYLDGVTESDRRRAARGFKLLQVQPGRIGPGRHRLEEGAWRGWRDDVEHARDLQERYPSLSLKVIAEAHLGIPYSTLRKYFARDGRATKA